MQGKHFIQRLRTVTLVAGVWLGLGLAHAQEATTVPPMRPLFIRWGNGLRTAYLVFNALLTNPEANELLSQQPLSTRSFESILVLHDALHDPAAREFMKYLVSCALDVTQQVSWTPTHEGGETQVWKGGGGICPRWNTGAPSTECLEQVSACVLALNNPAALRVRVALRCTEPGCAEALRPQQTVAPDIYTAASGRGAAAQPAQLIPSFLPCYGSVQEECGWYPLVTGSCAPGAGVNFRARAYSPISGWLRVCEGHRGCSGTVAARLSEMPFVSTDGVVVSFSCPASGAFSVMSKRTETAHEGGVEEAWRDVWVGGGSGRLSSEEERFPLREGAFWGSLFGTNAILTGLVVRYDASERATVAMLPNDTSVYVRQGEGWCRREGTRCIPMDMDPSVLRSQGPIYRGMHVCTAPEWEGDSQQLPGRVCALSGGQGNCAAHLEGGCSRFCKDGSDNTFTACHARGDTSSGKYAITTFMSGVPAEGPVEEVPEALRR